MPLLRTLRTAKRKELVGLIFLFSLGIITLAVSSGRFATMILIGNDISLCTLDPITSGRGHRQT